jgi:hypothetical protein
MMGADGFIHYLGLAYGLALCIIGLKRVRAFEALRWDALFLRQHSERTRPINLLGGVLVGGYALLGLLRQSGLGL